MTGRAACRGLALVVALGSACVALPLAHAEEPPPPRTSPLGGRWLYEDAAQKKRLAFLGDGRYWFTLETADAPTETRGRFRHEGATLTLEARRADAVSYTVALEGETLRLSGGDLGGIENVFRRVDSEAKLREEVAAADAAKEKDDAAWKKRVAVEARVEDSRPPRPDGTSAPAAGDLPEDPEPAKVFEKSDVFTKQQLFVHVRWQSPLVTKEGTPGREIGEGHDRKQWYFLPTGRCFYRAIVHVLSEEGEVQVEVTRAWGRYKVADEKVTLETDAGESLTLTLEDGRRSLVWDRTTYGQIDWEREALAKSRPKAKDE